MGLFQLTMYGVGLTLGAGIYVLIGEAAGFTGNSMWISFGLGAIVALLAGLSYSELTVLFPKAAAEYVFVKNAFKSEFVGFIVGWLTSITSMIVAATVALGFVGDIVIVANIVVFAIVITFAMVNLAVILLRYVKPDLERPFRVPVNIGKFPVLPLIGFIVTVYMAIQFELEIILVGLGIIGVGCVFIYFIIKEKSKNDLFFIFL